VAIRALQRGPTLSHGDPVRELVAQKIIELATEDRNPDVLCELALKEIRTGPADLNHPDRPAKARCRLALRCGREAKRPSGSLAGWPFG
jgi:hypothetical protein